MRAALLMIAAACSSSSPPPSNDEDVPDAAPGAQLDAAPLVDGAPSAACASKPAQPADATWSLTVGGRTRAAKVHVPPSYDPSVPTPVVINIHGRTHNASGQASVSRAIAKSNSAGFVVVHPEAATSPTSWNSGGGCCDPAASQDVDDVGFIEALLDELDARLCVDPRRVYVMGLSNGGYLANTLACTMADRIAAIGPVAGLLQQNPCTPSRAMPVMLVHGTDDTLVSYGWVDATVTYWKVTNGCTTTQTTYTNGDASCVTHGGCTSGADVVLCTIQGGGHQWPGGETLPFLGKKSDDLSATDALWDFFVAHPRP